MFMGFPNAKNAARMEYFIHHSKFKNINSLILRKTPILFSTVKLKLGDITFPISFIDPTFGIFESRS